MQTKDLSQDFKRITCHNKDLAKEKDAKIVSIKGDKNHFYRALEKVLKLLFPASSHKVSTELLIARNSKFSKGLLSQGKF